MNQPIWIIVAVAIVTAIGPSLAEVTKFWLRRKRSQATANPETNQPKAEKANGRLKYRAVLWATHLIQWGAFAWTLVTFVRTANRAGPVERPWVVLLVIAGMSVTFQLAFIAIPHLLSLRWRRQIDEAFENSQAALKAAGTSLKATGEIADVAGKTARIVAGRLPQPPAEAKRKRTKPPKG
jgi:hypothetical protein